MNIDKGLIDDVKNIYAKTDSIRETASVTKMSEQRVRRLLVTWNVAIKSPTTQRILKMYRSGKTLQEIAEIEGKTRNAVISHLPYTKGPYVK